MPVSFGPRNHLCALETKLWQYDRGRSVLGSAAPHAMVPSIWIWHSGKLSACSQIPLITAIDMREPEPLEVSENETNRVFLSIFALNLARIRSSSFNSSFVKLMSLTSNSGGIFPSLERSHSARSLHAVRFVG